jgi:hypothetical protein
MTKQAKPASIAMCRRGQFTHWNFDSFRLSRMLLPRLTPEIGASARNLTH